MRINKNGLTPDPVKVEAGLAEKTKNIRKLLKKDAHFKWSKECQQEFEAIKEVFSGNILLAHFDPNLETSIEVDASQSGLSAILVQRPEDKLRVVAVASRSTSDTESQYPQIDLEAFAIDYGLRRFRFYLEGAAQFTVYTDHQPLQSIFRNTRSGSVRTERIRLRHQNLDYKVIWKKGKTMRSDHLSRHALPWSRVPKEEQEEAKELDKLIWFIQYDPYIEAITVEKLVLETEKDRTLQTLKRSIRRGYIRKSETDLKPYKDLIQEMTITSEGLIMKGDKIILPEKLIHTALKKAHQGGHPGITNLKRRVRSHFFWPTLSKDVKEMVNNCKHCAMFTEKNRKTNLTPHNLKDVNCWERLSIDLFGPLPNNKSVLVAQDMVSKFPVAKMMNRTDAENVTKVLEDFYTSYGITLINRTDNGPPFNSQKFKYFLEAKGIAHEMAHPYHPNSNYVEKFMKNLGKCLKVALQEGRDLERAMNEFLRTYRATPHTATEISPGDMCSVTDTHLDYQEAQHQMMRKWRKHRKRTRKQENRVMRRETEPDQSQN